MIKKFFDADANEVASAPPAEQQPTVNPLSALASAGRMNFGGGQLDDVPEYKPQEQSQESQDVDVPADTATTQADSEAEVADVQPQAEAEEVAGQVDTEQPTAAEVRWQEIIKKEATETVLKELGFDDKVAGFLNHWKSGGDIQEYLREMATDYTKMPAEDVMRRQLRNEYPEASERQLELLFEEEVLRRYNIHPEDNSEDEIERGKELLEVKAMKYRKDLIANQQKYLLPPAPQNDPSAFEPDTQAIEQQRIIEDTKKSVLDSQPFRQVLSTNKLTIGEGDEAFQFPVDAKELPDIIYDSEKFLNSMFTVEQGKDGKVSLKADPEKQMLVAAVAKHGKQLFVELAKHYKAIGGKKAIEPIENPSTPQGVKATNTDAQNLTPAAMLAKMGRMGS